MVFSYNSKAIAFFALALHHLGERFGFLAE